MLGNRVEFRMSVREKIILGIFRHNPASEKYRSGFHK